MGSGGNENQFLSLLLSASNPEDSPLSCLASPAKRSPFFPPPLVYPNFLLYNNSVR